MNREENGYQDEPVLTAMIHGTKEKLLAAAAAAAEADLEFCIIGENGVTFFMSSGFILMERVAAIIGLREEDITTWEELSDADRMAWGSLAAGNLQWAMDPERIDAFDVETLVADEPGILERLTAPMRRRSATLWG